jgi:hypothetical protein
MKLLGKVTVGFDVTGQLLIILFAFIRYQRRNTGIVWQYIILRFN